MLRKLRSCWTRGRSSKYYRVDGIYTFDPHKIYLSIKTFIRAKNKWGWVWRTISETSVAFVSVPRASGIFTSDGGEIETGCVWGCLGCLGCDGASRSSIPAPIARRPNTRQIIHPFLLVLLTGRIEKYIKVESFAPVCFCFYSARHERFSLVPTK